MQNTEQDNQKINTCETPIRRVLMSTVGVMDANEGDD
jgi:hypothetical protein